MIRRFVVLLLSVVFSDSQPALLVFSSTDHQVGAHVAAGSNTDEHLDSTLPHPLPLSTSALAAAGVGNRASASDFADEDVVVASAQSSSPDTDSAEPAFLARRGQKSCGTYVPVCSWPNLLIPI